LIFGVKKHLSTWIYECSSGKFIKALKPDNFTTILPAAPSIFHYPKIINMKSYLLLIVSALSISLASCTKDSDDSASVSDATLSSMSSTDDLVLIRSVKTDNNSEWKIKMNDVAARAYAEGVKNYPLNSMIVKEKYDASGKLTATDVMYHSPADKNEFEGWLWSESNSDGQIIYSTADRGMSCQGCHSALTKTSH
jgi:hypothetical protein